MRRVPFGLAPWLLPLMLIGCGMGHPVRMLQESRPFAGRRPLEVVAELPAGDLRVSRGSHRNLYELDFSYCRNHLEARNRFERGDFATSPQGSDRLFVTGREIGSSSFVEDEPNLLELRLRPGIPSDLRLTAGEGGEIDADLTALSVWRMVVHGGSGPVRVAFKAGNPVDLEQLRVVAGGGAVRLEGLGWASVRSLQFYGGAGPVTLDFSGPGPREAAAFLDLGSGPLELVIPKDLGVEISGKGVIPASPPEGLLAGTKTWVSPNHLQAERHLTLVMDRGSAPVRVRWLP